MNQLSEKQNNLMYALTISGSQVLDLYQRYQLLGEDPVRNLTWACTPFVMIKCFYQLTVLRTLPTPFLSIYRNFEGYLPFYELHTGIPENRFPSRGST